MSSSDLFWADVGRFQPGSAPAVAAVTPFPVSRLAPARKPLWRDLRWNRWLAVLAQFRAEHGHSRVRSNDPRYCGLNGWLSIQVRHLRNGTLSPERKRALARLGIVARRQIELDVAWGRKFSRLLAYGVQHGHYNVPTNRPEFVNLSRWVSNQLRLYRNGEMPASRAVCFRLVAEDRKAA